MSISSYAAAPEAKLAEIIRLAEMRLASQLSLGTAADQRAMTMASILAAIDAALIGLVALTHGSDAPASLIILIIGFGIGVGLAAWSALPIAWDVPGNEPRQWLEDIEEEDSLHNGFAAMAFYYNEMIEANDRRLRGNANLLRGAFLAVVLTLIISVVSALLGF